MLRAAAFALLASSGPVSGWEFTPAPICTLSHTTPVARVIITYDPALPLYEIAITLAAAKWPAGDGFGIRFDGPRGLTIGTRDFVISPDGRRLSVTDQGFGNVLNGLEFNDRMIARIGDQRVTMPLDDAGPPTAQFRACPTSNLS